MYHFDPSVQLGWCQNRMGWSTHASLLALAEYGQHLLFQSCHLEWTLCDGIQGHLERYEHVPGVPMHGVYDSPGIVSSSDKICKFILKCNSTIAHINVAKDTAFIERVCTILIIWVQVHGGSKGLGRGCSWWLCCFHLTNATCRSIFLQRSSQIVIWGYLSLQFVEQYVFFMKLIWSCSNCSVF